jgi:preprotein translocase subunit SecA
MSLIGRLLRAGEGKKVKALQSLVPDINALEPEMEALSDDALRGKTAEFRQRLAGVPEEELNEALNEMMLEAFAVVREAAKRRRPALRLDRRDEDR